MFPSGDPTLLGPKPEAQESKARAAAVKEFKDFAKRVIGHNIPPYLDGFIERAIDGPKRRVIEGTDILPKGGTFETDRDAAHCSCGELIEGHSDDYSRTCSVLREPKRRENFDPFSTVGYLSKMERLRALEDE